MKRLGIVLCCCLALACGGADSSCTSPPQPGPTPEPAPTATASAPEPEPTPPPAPVPTVDWKPMNTTTRDILRSTGQCAFMYFGGSDCGPQCAYVEGVVFHDKDIVNIINDMYVSVRFPVDGNKDNLKRDFEITDFPTFMLIFADDESQSSIISGVGPVEEFKKLFRRNDERYKECKALKDKTNE
jgi:hypothetical protein